MTSAQTIGLLFDSASDNMGDKAIGRVLTWMFEQNRIPYEIVDPFRPDLSKVAMLVIGGGELIRSPGHPFYDAFRVAGPHVLNSVGVLDGSDTEYLEDYSIVTVRSQADRAHLGRGEVVPCLTLLYPDFYQPGDDDCFDVPEGAIGIHLTANFRHDALKLARSLDRADIGPLVLLPVNHYQADERIQNALAKALPKARVLPKLAPDQAFAVIGRLRLLVTCSLHATLLAYARGTPFLTYGAIPKVEAFLRERGLDHQAIPPDADMESLLQALLRSSHHPYQMFEQDRNRCRALAKRIVVAADAALTDHPPKQTFAIKPANPVSYQREMTAAFAAGVDAANLLARRIELEGQDKEGRTLEGELQSLQNEIGQLQAQCDEYQSENERLWTIRNQLLASSSWRITAPARRIWGALRNLGIAPRTIRPALRFRGQGERGDSIAGPDVAGRSPEHMPLVTPSRVNTDLRLVALCGPPTVGESAEAVQLETWRERAVLARQFGIYGFCFPYRPSLANSFAQMPWSCEGQPPSALRFCFSLGLAAIKERPAGPRERQPDIPSAGYIGEFLREMLPALRHPQHIRVHDRPLVLLTESVEATDALVMVQQLREHCAHNGYPEPFVVAVKRPEAIRAGRSGSTDAILETFDRDDPSGFARKLTRSGGRDYRSLIKRSYATSHPPRKVFQSVLIAPDIGDRTSEPHFRYASVAAYQEWLENACLQTQDAFGGDERLVFIQGWNADGTVEPFGWTSRYRYAYINATAKALESVVTRPHPPAMQAAVIVHAYYPQIWPEISGLLKRLESPFGLYITAPNHSDPSFIDAVRTEWPQAVFRTVENRGRDIAPFLAMTAQAIDDGHSLICKVHTKKSPHRMDGDIWRQDMLTKLLGGFSLARIARSFHENAALGMVGPEGHIVPGDQNLRLNRRHLSAILKKIGYEDDPMPFVFSAGSMFWSRADALKPLLDLKLPAIDFEPERGQLDGTLAHALERAFPLAARLRGYRITDTRVFGQTWGESMLRSDVELKVYRDASSNSSYL
jgi:hypothetical protein